MRFDLSRLLRPYSLFGLLLAGAASLAACSTDATRTGYIGGLAAPVPRPDARWDFQRTTPTERATVQFVTTAPHDAREIVEETLSWYEDLMFDLGWNESGEAPPRWSPGDRAYEGTSFWREEIDDRPRGAMIWVTGTDSRVILRVFCCEASSGDPGP